MPDNIYYTIILATPGGHEYIDYVLDEERALPYVLNKFFEIWDTAPQGAKDNIIKVYDCTFDGEPVMALEEYNHTRGTTKTILTLKDILSDEYTMTCYSKELEDALRQVCMDERPKYLPCCFCDHRIESYFGPELTLGCDLPDCSHIDDVYLTHVCGHFKEEEEE